MSIEPKTEHLENCLRILGGWYLNEDERVINELLDPKQNHLKLLHKPFTQELNKNLLSIESKEGKTDLIRHYMMEFWELQSLYRDNEDILFNGSLRSSSPVEYTHILKGKERKLDKLENYIVVNYNLFAILINEIQIVCLKYQIDFIAMCHELHYETELLDVGVTLAFQGEREDQSSKDSKRKSEFIPKTFKDIFAKTGWEKYILVFEKCDPPLIDNQRLYTGNNRGHKGVICSWLKDLQNKGVIKRNINRSQLAKVVNHEIKNIDLGEDGKTFDNYSNLYIDNFKDQFLKLTE
jgi:hypothetical protein